MNFDVNFYILLLFFVFILLVLLIFLILSVFSIIVNYYFTLFLGKNVKFYQNVLLALPILTMRYFFIYITVVLLYNIPMKTGAIILAAGRPKQADSFEPLQKIDGVSTIRRLIITLKHAGISPVTVITGEQGDAVEKEVAPMNVICLRNPYYQTMQMFGSIQMGIHYMEDLCDRLLILPAKFSLLLSNTVTRLMASNAAAVCPVYQGQRGHPVLISHSLFPVITGFSGGGGLRGALELPEIASCTEDVPVEDNGIIQGVDTGIGRSLREQQACLPTYCRVDLAFCREEPFFHSEAARFLELIAHTGSMQTACRQLHISYSKGWKIIKTAESYLGYPLLSTQTGGVNGGSSCLTAKGQSFLERYLEMEDALNRTGSELYAKLFAKGDML